MRQRAMTTILLMMCSCLLLASAGHTEEVSPGVTGPALAAEIRTRFAPSTPTTNYRGARQTLFGKVEVDDANQVRLIYTEERIAVGAFPDSIPDESIANTEHVWPQSRFKDASKRAQIKCDMHHLFPARPKVNTYRGNSAFMDIPDNQTQRWFISNDG